MRARNVDPQLVKPVTALDPDEADGLRGLLFDLDDTLLSHGLLTRASYDALWNMYDAGLKLVAVTGRPTGWGEVVARQWPIAGCVVENGAVYLRRQGATVLQRDACDGVERELRRTRLGRLVAHVRQAVPEARLTDDAAARRSDVTWDIGENATLDEDSVGRLVREIEAAGGRWSRSSVHLHATFDVDDKASGAVRFCARELGEEPGAAVVHFAFVGDSDNDASCFAAFRTTFGVANIRSRLGRLSVPPRYIATRSMGEGFAEVASQILEKRLSAGGARVC
jgi:hydroxymethylpyrimidine pyrophosphatase-like HAD family hydrolase